MTAQETIGVSILFYGAQEDGRLTCFSEVYMYDASSTTKPHPILEAQGSSLGVNLSTSPMPVDHPSRDQRTTAGKFNITPRCELLIRRVVVL